MPVSLLFLCAYVWYAGDEAARQPLDAPTRFPANPKTSARVIRRDVLILLELDFLYCLSKIHGPRSFLGTVTTSRFPPHTYLALETLPGSGLYDAT